MGPAGIINPSSPTLPVRCFVSATMETLSASASLKLEVPCLQTGGHSANHFVKTCFLRLQRAVKKPSVLRVSCAFQSGISGQEPLGNAGYTREVSSIPGSGRFPRRTAWNPFLYSSLEIPHWQKSQAVYSSWGGKESDIADKGKASLGRVLRTKLCRNPRPPGDSRQARIPHHPSPKGSGRGDIGPHPSEKEPLPRQAAQQPFFLEVPALILSSREVSGVRSVRLQRRAPKWGLHPPCFKTLIMCVS